MQSPAATAFADNVAAAFGRIFDVIGTFVGLAKDVLGVFAGPLAVAQDIIGDFGNVLRMVFDPDGEGMSGIGQFRDQFAGLGEFVVPVIQRIAQYVEAGIVAFKSLWASGERLGAVLGNIFGMVIPHAISVFRDIFAHAFEATAPVVTWFTQTILPTITQWAASVVDWFKANWQTIGGAINTVLTVAGFIIKGFIDTMAFLLSAVMDVWPAIQVVIETVVGVIGGIIEAFLAILAGDWGKAWEAVKGVFVTIWNGIVKFIGTIPGLILGILKGLLVAVMIWAGGLLGNLLSWAGRLVGQVAGQIGQLPGRFMGVISSLPGRLGEFFGHLISRGLALVGSLVSKLVGEIGKFPGRAIQGISKLGTMLWEFIKSLPGRIMGALTNVGGAIVKGIWDGITGLAGWFADQVTGFVKGIVDGVAGFLGIASPSKVFAGIGANMVRGLAQGVADRAGEAVRAMQRTAADMTAATAGGFTVNREATADIMHRVVGGVTPPPFSPVGAGPTIVFNVDRFVGRDDEARYYADLMARQIRLQGA
jgi:phage-related protein